jgi:alpha-amylase
MALWYKPSKTPKRAPLLWYRVDGGDSRSVRMVASCDGWYSVKLTVPQGAQLKLVFDVDGVWDNNGVVNGVTKGYVGSGSTIGVSSGNVMSGIVPNCRVQ